MAKRSMYSKTKKSNHKGGKRKMSKKLKKSKRGGVKGKSTSKSGVPDLPVSTRRIKKNTRQENKKIQKADLIKRYEDKQKELDKIDEVLMDNDPGEIGMNALDLSGHLAMQRKKVADELDKLDDEMKRCEPGSGCSIMG